MTADIISTNATTILEDFQSAYYDQIGTRMTIGSEEYLLSSIFTYVLTLYAGLINTSYKNQLIDTAAGPFLDNIAARYNLNRTPNMYSNPWFEGLFSFALNCEYRGRSYNRNTLIIKVADHTYSNANKISAATSDVPIRFICTKSHSDYLSKSELITALKEVKDSNDNVVFKLSSLTNYNVSDLQGVQHSLTDDELRKYIKSSKQLYVPGTAGAFEAIAKASSKDIVDAHVRVQSDIGFRPGYVDLYCKPYHYNGAHQDYSTMIESIDIPEVASVISSQNLAVIGQTVNVYTATALNDARAYDFFVPETYHTSEYVDLYTWKFKAVIGYLNTHVLGINVPFMPSMTVGLMTKNLSDVSADPHDFGFAPEDTGYQLFDKYKDLPVIGLRSVSDYSKLDSKPTAYIYIIYSDVKVTFI